MPTKRGFTGWRSMSKAEEATYDSPATINTTYRYSGDPVALQVELDDGTTLVGSEAEEADEQEILARHAEVNEDLPRLRPHEAALGFAFLLGNRNQSPADEPASGYRTHTFTPVPKTFANGAQDGSSVPLTVLTVEDTASFPSSGTIVHEATGNAFAYTGKTATTFTGVSIDDNVADNASWHLQDGEDYSLPSFTLLDYPGTAYKRQYPGCMLTSFAIEGSRKGFIRASRRILGSGTFTEPATTRPSELTEVYLKFGDCQVNIGGTFDGRAYSGGTSLNAKIRQFRWEGTNQTQDDLLYLAGSGDKMGRAERLRRSQSLQVALELADHTELDYVTAQTNLNLQVNLVGASGSYAVKLIWPQFRFNTAPLSGGTGVLIRTLEAGVQEHTTYGSFFAQVINQQTGYLV